jgi:hypothetical protein
LLFGGLLLAGIFLLAWVVVPQLRRYTSNIPNYWQARSLTRPGNLEANVAQAEKDSALRSQLFGGRRQVSLQLTACGGRPAFSKTERCFDGLGI